MSPTVRDFTFLEKLTASKIALIFKSCIINWDEEVFNAVVLQSTPLIGLSTLATYLHFVITGLASKP